MESTSISVISVKYDKFWRFGVKSILQQSLVQRIFLPRQIGSSLQFQVKEQPAAAEAVAKEEIEEVGGSGTIGAGFEERLWSILEVGPLKWPFGNPCDNVTASSLPFDSGCCHRNLSRLQPRQFFQPLWLEVEVLSWKSWNVSKMNLDDKWTRTDLTDQIAKLRELKFFHGVACESKHGWCVRHLKQPPHQLKTTSFEDSGLNPFYNNPWYKGFFFRDKLAHLCSFRPRRSLQEVKVWPRSRRWGKVARLVRGLKDDFGAFWNYRASFHVTASSLPGLPLESGCCHRNLRRFQPSQFIQPLWLEIEVLLEIYDM